MFEWKICVVCEFHFCALVGTVNFWWWRNLALCTIHRWWHHLVILRCGHILWIIKCRTLAPVTIRIVHREVIREFGNWLWINWKPENIIAAWLTVVLRIWTKRMFTHYWNTISNDTTIQIGHHTDSSFIPHGLKNKNIWKHSSNLWTTCQSCQMFILFLAIKQFSGCGIQHQAIK